MPVPYSSIAIANHFIEQFGKTDGIEHMKLQKLVYCSYGWWLAVKGIDEVRLTKDHPEIWKHGPVFSNLYNVFKVFGRQCIKEMQSSNPFVDPENIDHDDSEVKSLIKWVWGRYGHLSSFALSDMTHKLGTPWYRVATENNFKIAFNTKIPDKYIFEEFQKLLKASDFSPNNIENNANGEVRQQA